MDIIANTDLAEWDKAALQSALRLILCELLLS